jgi:hypothetical protein
LACAALVGLVALQLSLPAAGPPPQIAFLAARRPRPVVIPPLPEYPAILRAPIFAPDRRPGDPVTPGASGAGDTLDGYAALGAVVGRSVATAVISGPGVGARTVKRGEVVNGWRLAGVGANALTFERGGVRRVLVVGAPAAAVDQAAPEASEPLPSGPAQAQQPPAAFLARRK